MILMIQNSVLSFMRIFWASPNPIAISSRRQENRSKVATNQTYDVAEKRRTVKLDRRQLGMKWKGSFWKVEGTWVGRTQTEAKAAPVACCFSCLSDFMMDHLPVTERNTHRFYVSIAVESQSAFIAGLTLGVLVKTHWDDTNHLSRWENADVPTQ